jgi:hypothetical protein
MTKAFAHSVLCVVLTATVAASPGRADEPPLLTVVSELKAQQAQISENETKIEAKLTSLADTIRVARIFMSRGGGGHKLPKKK